MHLLTAYAILCGSSFSLVTSKAPAPAGLELVVLQQLAAPPLPFQAVRLRVALRNSGETEVHKLECVDMCTSLTAIKRPNDFHYERPSNLTSEGSLELVYWPHVGSFVTARQRMANAQHINLRPGDQHSVTASFIGSPSTESMALFPRPGEYHLQLTYWVTRSDGFKLLAKPLPVTVKQPHGDDAIVIMTLEQQPQIAKDYIAAINHRTHPIRADTISAMESIVGSRQGSSFADYARFILASHYVQQKDDARALHQLRSINVKDFPYAVDVLLMLKRLTHKQADTIRILAALQANFPDAIEWLEDEATFLSFDQIQERRNVKYYDPDRAAATLDDLIQKEADTSWIWLIIAAIVGIPSLIYLGVYLIRRVASKRSAA